MDAQFFAALSEPHRLNIVELLRNGPRPVGDIVTNLKLNQPQVSKHLRVLADAGIVEAKPDKQKRVYELQAKPLKEVAEWAESFRKIWEARFERLDAVIKPKT